MSVRCLQLGLLLIILVPASAAAGPRGFAAQSPNPLKALQFYVDQESASWQQWKAIGERARRARPT